MGRRDALGARVGDVLPVDMQPGRERAGSLREAEADAQRRAGRQDAARLGAADDQALAQLPPAVV